MKSQDSNRDSQSKRRIRFTSAARKAKALRKLGVSPEQLADAPEITSFLADSRGSRGAVLAAMRLSQDAVVQRFLATHDSLGVWDRDNTCWEVIALAAGVSPAYLLGAALLALRAHKITAGKFIAMSHYPEVMEKRIEYAKLRGGWRDRDFLAKLVGLLPAN